MPSSPMTPEFQVVRSAADQMLINALNQLRWSDKEVLRLATWERLPHEAIGELLGITEAAVGQRISRARKRLGKELRRMENRQQLPTALLRKRED